MHFLQEKKEQYYTNWFLKTDIDLFKEIIEEEIRKKAKYNIKYINFEALDCVPDWIDGEIKEVVRYAVYVGYEIEKDIKVVSITKANNNKGLYFHD